MNNPSHTQHLLWLDPFRALSDADRAQLAAAGLAVHPVATLDDLREQLPQAGLIALRLEGTTDLLRDVQALQTEEGCALAVLCRVERRELELAVAAMRLGAQHVLAADDFSAQAWQNASQRPVAATQAAKPQAKTSRTVVYVDPASRNLLALAQRVARAPVSVLIEGPTGAGKEVLARVLHESSARAQGPFVALNCAALPDHLIEDMLFGHEKGAFTGALKEHRGLFEQAQGGTVFLDEIAEMPIHLQAKLLRVLQERQLTRLGGERALDIDVRVLAATNRDLRVATASREFREDLYFRLSTFKLRVPALRERPGDILPLAARLLMRHAEGGRALSVSSQAQDCLKNHPWPGNVRELENVVMRALVLCTGEVILPEHLMFDDAAWAPSLPQAAPTAWQATLTEAIPAPVGNAQRMSSSAPSVWSPANPPAQADADATDEPANLHQAVQMNEQQLILAAVQSTYSRLEAAAKLGISPRTLRYKLAKLKGGAPALA
jgi:two-component system, response regulator FlrC